jgi:hypothetical protein
VIQRLRKRLTYANVVATLAVFIALGGSSYAALRITGRDVANNSLTYKDLRRNTLGSSRIRESRLGTVPRANNAARLNGMRPSQFLVRCPQATVPVSDVCVETQARAAAPYGIAAAECESTDRPSTPGRRLPSHDELTTAMGEPGVSLAPGGELTRNVYPASAGRLNVLYLTDDVGSVGLTPNTAAGAKAFRCVLDPLN